MQPRPTIQTNRWSKAGRKKRGNFNQCDEGDSNYDHDSNYKHNKDYNDDCQYYCSEYYDYYYYYYYYY